MRFVTLIGNPKAESRTHRVAMEATRAVIAATGLQAAGPTRAPAAEVRHEVVDLSGLACRLLLPQASAAIEDAVESVIGADVLVVASPVFKGSYTGLLKVFLDRLSFRALSSVMALPVLVMKHPEHALAVEVHLRPLLVELGATVPTPGLALFESELGRLDQVLASWSRRVAGSLPGVGPVTTGGKGRAEGNGRPPRPAPPRPAAPRPVLSQPVLPQPVPDQALPDQALPDQAAAAQAS
ncbi:MAG TPA: NAD(P)H-dependent oxidoreductase [Streptosporangiaceae bacterium]